MDVSQYFSELGKRGGQQTSQAKAIAAKRNASRPRPNARGPRKPDHLTQPESIKRRYRRNEGKS